MVVDVNTLAIIGGRIPPRATGLGSPLRSAIVSWNQSQQAATGVILVVIRLSQDQNRDERNNWMTKRFSLMWQGPTTNLLRIANRPLGPIRGTTACQIHIEPWVQYDVTFVTSE